MQILSALLCVGDGDEELGADDGDADVGAEEGGVVGEDCAPADDVEDVIGRNAWRGV